MTKTEQTARQAAAFEYDRKNGFHVTKHATVNVWISWKVNSVTGKASVKAYRGISAKAAFYYGFKDQAKAETYVGEFVQRLRDHDERKAASKKEDNSFDAAEHWTVGDVVYNSWGYDQTNVDFYQVTRVSSSSVWIRRISANSSDRGQVGGGKCFPRRNEFTGEEIRKRATRKDYLSMEHGCCSKWDGRAKYCSSDR